MYSEKKYETFKSDQMDKWLESFFLDPFTSILDQTQFRVDLFDTETDLIIEALLPQYQPEGISLFLDCHQVIIKACNSSSLTKERTINFPFKLNSQKVTATYSNDILEIVISKIHQDGHKNRNIPLTY